MLKHLVIAGGGPRCITFLGALQVLHRDSRFNEIKDFWGNSAGAIMATLLALKVPYEHLRNTFEHIDFTKFRDIDLANLMSFSQNWGLDSGEAFMKNITDLLEDAKPGSSEFTLQELPGLHITCADLTTTKPAVLDAKSFPTMKVIDALRASTSIPFFYRPFRNPINGHMLVDGAVACNFPWVLLPSDADRDAALGFDFRIMDYSKEPRSLSEFIPKILNFKDVCWGSKHYKPSGPNIIRFDVRGFPAWHLGLTKEDRDELITIGVTTTERWLSGVGEAWLLTSHSQLGKLGNPPQSGRPYTRRQVRRLDCINELSDSHESQRPVERPRDSYHDSPCEPPPVSRRWSV